MTTLPTEGEEKLFNDTAAKRYLWDVVASGTVNERIVAQTALKLMAEDEGRAAASGVRVPSPEQRARFEQWAARTLGIGNFDKDDDGVAYLNGDTDDLWCCWQEAVAGVTPSDGGQHEVR